MGYTSQGGLSTTYASMVSTVHGIGWKLMGANFNRLLHAAIQRLPSCSTTRIASHTHNSEKLEAGYSFVCSRPGPYQIGSMVCRSISIAFESSAPLVTAPTTATNRRQNRPMPARNVVAIRFQNHFLLMRNATALENEDTQPPKVCVYFLEVHLGVTFGDTLNNREFCKHV